MGTAGYIMASASVIQYTADQAAQHGYTLEPFPLDHSVFIERRLYLWVVRVREPDPQAAAFIANTWIQRAYQDLQDAANHAARAEALYNYLQSLESCLQRVAISGPALPQCSVNNLASLQQELGATGAQYDAEQFMGRGFLPYLTFDQPTTSGVPGGAQQFGLNSLVLAGILIAFLLAIGAVAADLPLALAQRIHNARTGAEPRR